MEATYPSCTMSCSKVFCASLMAYVLAMEVVKDTNFMPYILAAGISLLSFHVVLCGATDLFALPGLKFRFVLVGVCKPSHIPDCQLLSADTLTPPLKESFQGSLASQLGSGETPLGARSFEVLHRCFWQQLKW